MKNKLMTLLLCVAINSYGGNPNEINLHLNMYQTNSSISERGVCMIGGGLFVLAGVLNMTMNSYGNSKSGVLNQPLINKNSPNCANYSIGNFLPIMSGVAMFCVSLNF